MSFQLAPLDDDVAFERLVRDILRRVYDDPGIERFGRTGQVQFGIDGSSPEISNITFQCKLKDVRYKSDEDLRQTLLTEMADELKKTEGLANKPGRFIFASTFKNDRVLQEKADSLSTDVTTVEYWGWDTISERIWELSDVLIPIYYPQIPVRRVTGFRQITVESIDKARISDPDKLNTLAFEYYRINDRSDLVFQVVCNDIDVRNSNIMSRVFERLKSLPPSGTLWLVGDGGSGKTTILHRVAIELTQAGQAVFTLNLDTHLTKEDVKSVLWVLKYASSSGPTVLCIDNPAADEEILEMLLREIPEYTANIHVVLAERGHRYRALVRTGCLTYLHGEDETAPLPVRNSRNQREQVYDKLFKLLGVSEADAAPLREIALNEKLVYVNATYSILLELKKKRKIDFDFDWDDYRKATSELPAFREGYKYIALFYLFGVRTPFSVFSRICGADAAQQNLFLETFRGLVNEPIVVDERRDGSFRKNVYVRTKHEIISEIFFQQPPQLDRDELLMTWAEHADFGDPVEAQALINIFGAKKNYLAEETHVDFRRLIDFLLVGHVEEKVASSRKLYATLHLAKFWLLMLQDKVDEGIEVLRTYLEIEPENLHCRTELAKAYQQQGKLDAAEVALLEVLDRKPNDLESRNELAKVYQRQNRLTEAEAVLREILSRRHDDLNSRTELAKVYQTQHKFSEAEAVLLELLEIDNRNIRAFTELARVYQRQNRLSDAEAMLLRVIEINANDLNSRTELAKIYQRQGKLELAESRLLEGLEIDNKQLHPRTELAKIYQRQGKLELAESRLLESLEIDDKQLHPRLELAKIYQRQGKLDQAIQRLEEYIEHDPERTRPLHPLIEMAKIYQRQGKLDEAERMLTELLNLDEDNLQARTELAKIYQRQGKLELAESRLLESLEIDDKQLHPRTELAKIYQRQGKLELAESRLLESLEIDDKQLHPRTELAKIYQRQGKFELAIKRGEEALSIDPINDHAMSELLASWQRQGEKEKCARRFMEFISQPRYRFSRSSQAPFFRFFQCCRRFGMNDLAKQVFQRFESDLDDRNVQFYRNTFT